MKILDDYLEKLRKLELPYKENLYMDNSLCKINKVEELFKQFYDEITTTAIVKDINY